MIVLLLASMRRPVYTTCTGGRRSMICSTITITSYTLSNLLFTSMAFTTRIHSRSYRYSRNKLETGTLHGLNNRHYFGNNGGTSAIHGVNTNKVKPMGTCISTFTRTSTRLQAQQQEQDTNNQSSLPPSSSIVTKEMLQKYTIKQLRDKIRDLNLPIKISHLKIKKDFVDFLYHQYSSDTNNSNMNMNNRNKSESDISQPIAATSTTNNNDNKFSPRDIIFEHVYNRYPPLRDLNSFVQTQNTNEQNTFTSSSTSSSSNTNSNNQFQSIISYNPNLLKNLSGLGDIDIRQQHHPMIKSLTSSDLDIVTVGTASCIPGVTRGVSCTALRLQWRRNIIVKKDDNKGNGSRQNDSGKKGSGGKGGGGGGGGSIPTTGGIWIFDCGESTQVG